MVLKQQLGGAMTALVTPFDAQDRVDEAALLRIVDAQLARGIDGLVPCGTTGETPALDSLEQERVVRLVVERVAGKVPVIAGTGSNSTKVTVEQTKRALAWGIDAALVVCPYYNKPTQEGLYRHFKAVWEETGASIVAYNVPGRTVSDLQPETIGRLVELGAIVAIKDATADMARATETLAVTHGKPLALLSGDDFTILPFLACGGHGVISVVSNVAPGDTAKLVRECRAGRFAEARGLHERIVQLSRALFLVANPIPVKMAMHLTGWCAPTLRLPLVQADEATTAKLKAALLRYNGGAPIEGMMA